MRFVRFFAKSIIVLVLLAALFLLAANIGFKYFLPTDGVQKKISSFIAEKTNGGLLIDSVRAGVTGITAKGLKLTSPEGAEVLSAKQAHLRVNPIKLLRGELDFSRITIEGLTGTIIKDKSGKFNFEGLFSAENPQNAAEKIGGELAETAPTEQKSEEADNGKSEDNSDVKTAQAPQENKADDNSFIKTFRIKKLQIKESSLYYIDESSSVSASLEKLFIDLSDFNFTEPFRASVNAAVSYKDEKIKIGSVPVGITVYPSLNALELEKASADLHLAVIELGAAALKITGKADNFKNPSIKLSLQASGLSEKPLKNIVSLPEMNIGSASIYGDATYTPEESKLYINTLEVKALNSLVNTGGVIFLCKNISYNLVLKTALNLDSIYKALPMLKEYLLTGAAETDLKITTKDLSGSVSLENVGFYYSGVGTFSGVNLNLSAKSLKEISLEGLTGRLNGEPFRAALSYAEKDGAGDVHFNIQADKMIIKAEKSAAETYDPDAEPVLEGNPEVSPEVKKVWPFPPLNVQGLIQIGYLDGPYINANGLNFKADITNLTPKLAQTGGELSFSTEKGVIKDLYRLTNENALTKVLFVSLGIVSKLINTLDVLDLLNSISAAVLPTDKQKKALEEAPEKIKGSLPYERFYIDLALLDGVTDIKQGGFVSDLLSFKLDGSVNFNDRKIKMLVNTAPGRHETGGIMPLRINVGGTIDEPKGNISMLTSAFNMVGQTIFNNPGSRLVKKGVSKVFGLLGLKKKAETAEEDFLPIELPDGETEPIDDIQIINSSDLAEKEAGGGDTQEEETIDEAKAPSAPKSTP